MGLLLIVSLGLNAAIASFIGQPAARSFTEFESYPNRSLGLVAFGLLALSAFVSWRIGVNEFSMHHFYKNRLVRCYLGASRWAERHADWFTGFDPDDDLRLSDLDRAQASRYAGPYPILNAALNLVGGRDLAWQERKATSFVFTPKYCGYDVDRAVLDKTGDSVWPDGYSATTNYTADGKGPLLGTAMAISGAAANPNMGRATSPASAFLMTVFNVRLGWWLPNSRHPDLARASSPKLGLTYTMLELLGLTDDATKFVNVSDGGHFENLGIYELVRRGCRFIIASDAGQDGAFSLEDLGNVIRKCRTDFGVDIDICVDPIRDRDEKGWSCAHCVVGKIHYLGVPRHDAAGRILYRDGKPLHEVGWLIYLKPTITGDEPYDVLEYYKRVPEFPHESTADQWFNESQFESYRRLGYHIANTAFNRFPLTRQDFKAGDLFNRLFQHWHAPSAAIAHHATVNALEYSRLMEMIRSRDEFKALDPAMFRELAANPLQPGRRDEFYLCNALIQLMENVYFDLRLEENHDHPEVAGWMSVFRNWVVQREFQDTWLRSRTTYNQRFQRFYEDRLVKRISDDS